MLQFIKRCLLLLSFIALINPLTALAGDLDDGISKSTDDSITKDDELGQIDKNIKFIKIQAKSKAGTTAGDSKGVVTGSSGGGNMNSVLVGPGTNIRGDIIIIDESRGDKTQVVE